MRRVGLASFAAAALFLGCATDTDATSSSSNANDAEESVATATSAATVCAPADVVYGLDVSTYQGTVDWQAVADAGYAFAIARINHGSTMDNQFDRNWPAIKEVGMIRGAYQFFEPGLDVDWQAQIVIEKLGKLGPGDLPAVIDVESTSGLGPAEVAEAVGRWIELVEAGTGKKPIIYAGKYFWQDNVGSDAFADYPLWHAQYPDACQPPNNPPPPDCGCANIANQWSTWLIWQYTSSQIVPGITVNTVDRNVFYGDYADLVAFASQGGYAAKVLSVEAPATVLAGESFEVELVVENKGGKVWTDATRIGTTEPRDRPSAFHDASWLSESRVTSVAGVGPGETTTLVLTLTAPAEVGAYTESFGFVEESVAWFGDEGGPADDAITLDIQVVNAPIDNTGGAGGDGGGSTSDGDGDDDSSCAYAAGSSSRTLDMRAFVALGLGLVALARRKQR